jgi:hypothetical protein
VKDSQLFAVTAAIREPRQMKDSQLIALMAAILEAGDRASGRFTLGDLADLSADGYVTRAEALLAEAQAGDAPHDNDPLGLDELLSQKEQNR